MSTSIHGRAPLFAGAFILVFTMMANAQVRNCPSLVDQVIHVNGTQPVTFRLAVNNPEASSISVFQYPLGGILQQTGPTPLDFTFVPGPAFSGTTAMTYRLTPPQGCNGTVLGKVTLAGGPATSTAGGLDVNSETGLSEPPAPQGLDPLELLALGALFGHGGLPCGFGIVPGFMLTCACLSAMRTFRRRR